MKKSDFESLRRGLAQARGEPRELSKEYIDQLQRDIDEKLGPRTFRAAGPAGW